MSKQKYLFFYLLVLNLVQFQELFAQKLPILNYTVNLNDRTDDQFKVSLKIQGLKPENAIYQFASTAPGTYQVMDMGRFVRNFKALDDKGNELMVENISTNQWKISEPEKVREIRYQIAETWDTQVDKNKIYLMCGSSLEQDHTLINGQTVFGYPSGMQGAGMKIKLDYPKEWMVGTALNTDKEGNFVANSYDHIVDSPILLGRLTKASTNIKGVPIEIYTYSKTDKVKSQLLLNEMQSMLNAAGTFLKKLPVNRYTFLYHFEDTDMGAWEHSYSSEYVFKEVDYTPELGKRIVDIASHEFLHIVTPLNIHSEIIEKFNFVTPTPSEHLWLYEGTTEWATHIMQLRSGLNNLTTYLAKTRQKINVDNNYFDKDYSLSKLAMTSFSEEGQKQYGNIYNRGALVSGLLDIRILELSKGKKGLREVILSLAKKYGKKKAFSEKDFFKILVQMTHPEVNDFIEKYIKNANPLPYQAYYEKLGINYYEEKEGKKYIFEVNPNASPEQMALRNAWLKNL